MRPVQDVSCALTDTLDSHRLQCSERFAKVRAVPRLLWLPFDSRCAASPLINSQGFLSVFAMSIQLLGENSGKGAMALDATAEGSAALLADGAGYSGGASTSSQIGTAAALHAQIVPCTQLVTTRCRCLLPYFARIMQRLPSPTKSPTRLLPPRYLRSAV